MDELTTAEQGISRLLEDFTYKPGFLVRVVPASNLALTIEFSIPVWTNSGEPFIYGACCRIDWFVIQRRSAARESQKEFIFGVLRRAILDTELDIANKFFAGESPVV